MGVMGPLILRMANSKPAQAGPGLLVDEDSTARFTALFQELDQDANQVLSRDEIKNAMARALAIEQQEDPQPQGLQRTATALTTDYIADLDLNGDDEVTLDEWLTFWDNTSKQFPEMTIEWYMNDVLRPSFGL